MRRKKNPWATIAVIIFVILIIAIAVALTLQIISTCKGYTNFIEWGKTWSWITKLKK